MTSLQETLYTTIAGAEWRKITVGNHHGINIPLFSLHSKNSCGIGEFTDLLPLLPWCRSCGFDVIQLLPLNDTGPDTSPYSAISAFALNPLHIGLSALPHCGDYPELQVQLKAMQALTKTPRVDYEAVRKAKELFLRYYYALAGHTLIATADYRHFIESQSWLEGFCLFKAIKEAKRWTPWEQWEKQNAHPTDAVLQALKQTYKEEIAFHSFVQYLAFDQLVYVKEAAEKNNIFLMGDVPILIGKESADVWLDRSLFDLTLTAGAPPDMYAQEGQNWGFPTYRWQAMEACDYAWWKLRLRVASLFYHLYRIDHVVGFFRIWSIPLGSSGSHGHFVPEDPATWLSHGEKILQMMISAAPMLPIGEDLGTVPQEARECLKRLGIMGTKVMRWERRWNEDRGFIPSTDYLQTSLTTVSTHDSETLQHWWKNYPQEAQDYARFRGWDYNPVLSWEHHFALLKESHHTASLFHINLLNEYLALIPGLVHETPEEERINVPGIISKENWSYRFKPSVEEIAALNPLTALIKKLLA